MKKWTSILVGLALVLVLGVTGPAPVAAEDGIINVPDDHLTIQAAIDAASDGDTVKVAAGVYKENIVIHRSLTLLGAQAGVDARIRTGPETILEPHEPEERAGIEIDTTTAQVVVIDGLTVRNARHGITTPKMSMAAEITVKNVRVLDPFKFGISLSFTERGLVERCYVEGTQYGINAGAVSPGGPTVATFRNNEVVNTEFGISGYLESSLIEGNVVRDFAVGGVGISGQFFDTHIKNNTVSGYADGAAMSFEWHYGRGISENVRVEGNTFSKNRRGIHVFSSQTELKGIAVSFNNIVDNTGRGIENAGGEVLDAHRNWWGCVSGPYHLRENRDGKGNSVSAKVGFGSWLTAPVAVVKTDTVTGGGTVDATDVADTEVEITGTAAVVLAKYTGNPGDPPRCLTPLNKYIDVYIPDTGDVTEVEIRLYYTDAEIAAAGISEGDLRLFWWDGAEWVQCSDSEVHTDETSPYGGHISARMKADTVPSLEQLTGTPFAGYALPPTTLFVATGELPAGQVGLAYEATLEACGGEEPYTWAIVGGTLPQGLGLDVDTGIIAGRPTRVGGFEFTVSATDTAQVAASVELSITINPAARVLPCFVATAVYGTDTAHEIDVLREFRDEVLLSNPLGAGVALLYYRASPSVAEVISRHEVLRRVVRVCFVDPIVALLASSQGIWSGRGQRAR